MFNSQAFQKLQQHFEQLKNQKITDLFIDKNRASDFTFELDDIVLDISKNLITEETINLFLELAKELNLEEKISDMFKAKKINVTENRAVLHSALRDSNLKQLNIDGKDFLTEIKEAKLRFNAFVKGISKGYIKSATNKKFEHVVNIGIGGSYLGSLMAVNALEDSVGNSLEVHFISNIDAHNLLAVMKNINFETTLFIVASKTFTTIETITNAYTIKDMFVKEMGEDAIEKHFVALSTNLEAVARFGISPNYTFEFWDFIGGRYSIWSAIGMPLALKIGVEGYNDFLEGAQLVDNHLQKTKLEENIPFLLAIIGIWYNNFFNYHTYAILPYDYRLRDFTKYIQQLEMESNGKNITLDNKKVMGATSPVVFGEPGTDAQHSFFQLIHQGTTVIPCDFIGIINPNHSYRKHQDYLIANLLAQAEALMVGKDIDAVKQELADKNLNEEKINALAPHKVFKGNRPSNIFLLHKLTPKALGMLCAIYEHKVFIQGLIWNINSFDQWGVELGKEIANDIYKSILEDRENQVNSSTCKLIKIYKNNNDFEN